MIDPHDDTLAIVNTFLSALGLVLVILLAFSLRRRIRYTKAHGLAIDRIGRVHSIVGIASLLLYGLLSVITATGAILHVTTDGSLYAFQTVAIMLRVAIVLVLGAWTAWALEYEVRGRWPRLDRLIDRVLTFRRPTLTGRPERVCE